MGNSMKKILIILISILLLSSPVIGNNHKGETLYRWGENPDYKWMGFGDKDTHPVYQGQVKDGKPNGLGVIIYPDGIWKGGNKYVGKFKDGKFDGQGTFTLYEGIKYVGEFKDGEPWNLISYDKNGNIQLKFVNGESIEQ